jgi:hypothetical protein
MSEKFCFETFPSAGSAAQFLLEALQIFNPQKCVSLKQNPRARCLFNWV